MDILDKLLARIEIEAQGLMLDFESEEKFQLPKGYLDGQLWGFDLVQIWIRRLKNGEPLDYVD